MGICACKLSHLNTYHPIHYLSCYATLRTSAVAADYNGIVYFPMIGLRISAKLISGLGGRAV